MGAAQILAACLAILISSFGVHGNVFSLERAFPRSHHIGLDELQTRDRTRQAHLFKRVVGGIANVSVVYEDFYGPEHVGVYLTKVKLGSPPREFYVEIDTGSDVLWVSCSSCKVCPRHTELGGLSFNFYDPANSSTARPVPCSDKLCKASLETECSHPTKQCRYNLRYADEDEIAGYYMSDELYFDMIPVQSHVKIESSATVVFGCSTSVAGLLEGTIASVNGVFGFGQGLMSVISQLSSQGATANVFSHCLKGDDNGGGILVLGEILEPSIVYTPLVPTVHPFYQINLETISINGQIVPIDPAAFTPSRDRATVVDSGSTLGYIAEEAYDPLVHAITLSSKYVSPFLSPSGKQCYLVYTSVAEAFPTVSLNFAAGASMVLKPEDYLLYKGPDQNGSIIWCFGPLKSEGENRGFTILGDHVLKDKIVVYDIGRQRLGWADYNCSLPVNVSVALHGRDPTGSSSSRNLPFEQLNTGILLFFMHLFIIFM
ncbi:aspartic proteinase 36-like [Pyrus x bretschneideri]|uniref:aspartic proteinase 36-like n=1 Tax=Pyrus x bretschneideri TaxID=225117 RepID=UPI00202E7E3F|nr:aspartic proteinase 36-like [Pyrus x bretschneideri]